ncbi:MAG: hypothetical protein IKI95_07485, partial [Clostridia bacterium]|nr:hypothetical protein [Clostridia bacterium]
DGLVHYGLKVFATDFGQFIYVIKMNENNDYFCCSESWFNNFSITTFRDEVDRLKFFFIPKHDEIIKTSDECLDILKKGMILEIKIDKKIPRQAFCDYVLDLFTLFRDSVDIKKDIVDFLVDKLSDFYSTEVICYKEPEIDLIFRRIINNEDMYFFGTNNKNSKNKMIRNQNHFLERIINSLYQNLLVDNYSNSEMLCSLSRSSLLFYMNLLLGKLSETEFTSYSPAGEEIEIMAVYCHILIYMRLVYNQFFDKLKNINLDDVSVDYFKTEPGKLRLKLNELDMSYVEIIDINNKNNSHKVKSLSDKIFALRIIRNSISHNGFRYKITKTSSFADIVLNLSSLSNPNLVVRLEAVDLMVLLNEDLFKENTKVVENDDTTVSFIEIENYLKKIK